MKTEESRIIAKKIFLAGVECVKPENLINRFVKVLGSELVIDKYKINLYNYKNVYVIGAGKASAKMAQSIEKILGDRISEGHIITKFNHAVPLKNIGITEASHPFPDKNGIDGTSEILKIAAKAKVDDLVICLISGGGSALLEDIPTAISLTDLKDLNQILIKSGIDIKEMNCVRKHLSNVKGGQLFHQQLLLISFFPM